MVYMVSSIFRLYGPIWFQGLVYLSGYMDLSCLRDQYLPGNMDRSSFRDRYTYPVTYTHPVSGINTYPVGISSRSTSFLGMNTCAKGSVAFNRDNFSEYSEDNLQRTIIGQTYI